MDINKEREAFEQLQNPKFFQRAVYLDNSNAYVVNDEYRDDLFSLEWVQEINYGWLMWQAAKATPEGFVLVPKQPTPKMIDATWNFDEEIQDMSHNSRNEFIYNAMIAAAQEPTND